MNHSNNRNFIRKKQDNNKLNPNFFGEAEDNSQNKSAFILEDKKEVISFHEKKIEKFQISQTANKAKDLFITEKHSEAFKFTEKEANEFKFNYENNNDYAKNKFKNAESNENPFANLTKEIEKCDNPSFFQPAESQNTEEFYNQRMNNFLNYFDRKQQEKENNQGNNINYNNKNRNNSNFNNVNNNADDDYFNAKPIKRGQNVDYEDFSNSIYNVNRKKKNNNNNNSNYTANNYYKNKNKNNVEDEEEGSTYNIYANKKPKKQNKFNREEFENESFSAGGELIKDNNIKNKYNNNRQTGGAYQNQLYANKNQDDLEDTKFNETLKNQTRASNFIANKNKQDQNNRNKGKDASEVSNKYSVRQKFVPPKINNSTDKDKFKDDFEGNKEMDKYDELDKKLKGCDPKLIELIESEILSTSPDVKWDDIAGLEFAKKTIKEIIIWPMLRPDIFKGIRKPPKGLLLFGPPGTGKTMIAKAIASESKSSFFNISASSLMSKWIGESERLVRTLFALASFHQPSVVFIDEIDSILTSRSENENESSRRIKTEFLVQLDGAGTNQDDRILIIGATNRPQEIDEAFIRRLSKRLYIPLPNKASRKQLVENVINKESEKNNKYSINENDLSEILRITKGYSGSDLMGVCREAAMMPIRSIEDILAVSLDNIRDVCLNDFKDSVELVKPSVSEKTIGQYVQWNKDFGSFNFEEKDE